MSLSKIIIIAMLSLQTLTAYSSNKKRKLNKPETNDKVFKYDTTKYPNDKNFKDDKVEYPKDKNFKDDKVEYPNDKVFKDDKVEYPNDKIIRESAAEYSNKEIEAMANELNYYKTTKYPFGSHGAPVFRRKRLYITPDVDGHIDGFWKIFDDKGRRIGTYSPRAKTRLGK
jgi:hypothetical protein